MYSFIYIGYYIIFFEETIFEEVGTRFMIFFEDVLGGKTPYFFYYFIEGFY
jgi:hypothetical protein